MSARTNDIIGLLIVFVIFAAISILLIVFARSPSSSVNGQAPNSSPKPVNASNAESLAVEQATSSTLESATLKCGRKAPCAINLETGTKICRNDRSYYPTVEECTTYNGCPNFWSYSVDSSGLTSLDNCITSGCRCTNLLNLGDNLDSAFNITSDSLDYTIAPTLDYSDTSGDRPTIPNPLRGLVAPSCPYGQLMFFSERSSLLYSQAAYGSIDPLQSETPIGCVKATQSTPNSLYDRAQGRVTDLKIQVYPMTGTLDDSHNVELFIEDEDNSIGSFTVSSGFSFQKLPGFLTTKINEIIPFEVQVVFRYDPPGYLGGQVGNPADVRLGVQLIRSRVNYIRIVSSLFSSVGFLSSTIRLSPAFSYARSVDPHRTASFFD